jgi:pyridoxamine 5'-phosphate oxidase
MNISLPDLRQDYRIGGLLKAEADPNPFKQFEVWLKQALAAQLIEPNAMTLATVNHQGKPTARMVLLKDFNECDSFSSKL